MSDREVLDFTFTLQSMVVSHPLIPRGNAGIGMAATAGKAAAASTAASMPTLQNFAYYIKWKRGKDLKGKLPTVPCSAKTVKAFSDGKVSVVLDPMIHRIECQVRFKHKDNDAMLLEKKELDIEVLLIEFTTPDHEKEKQRRTLCSKSYDMRTFLQGSRRGAEKKQLLPLSATEHIETCLTISIPGVSPRTPPASPQPGAGEAQAQALMDDEDLITMAPVKKSEGSDGLAAAASQVVQTMQDAFGTQHKFTNPKTAVSGAMAGSVANLPGVANYRSIDLRNVNVPIAFTMLVADDAPFSGILHSARRDRGYLNTPWKMLADGSGGTKSISYDLKVGKSFVGCEERAGVAAFDNYSGQRELITTNHIVAPNAPLVGANAQLEFISHVGRHPTIVGGSRVTMVVAVSFSSSLVQSAASGKVKKQVEKFLDLMQRALLQLAGEKEAADAKKAAIDGMGSGDVDPLLFSDDATSLDFNIWHRLADYRTANNGRLVHHYLSRVLNMRRSMLSSPSSEQIGVLEDLLTLHRRDVAVVSEVCQLLRIFCDALGYASVCALCPTLPHTLAIALPPHALGAARDPTRMMYDSLLLARQQLEAQAHEELQRTSSNAWETLEKVIFDRSALLLVLGNLRRSISSSHIFTANQVDLLTKLLTIHVGDASVLEIVLGLMSTVSEKRPFLHDMVLFTTLDTIASMHPNLALSHRELLSKVLRPEDPDSHLTPFEKTFGHLIREPVEFTCSISLYEPKAVRGVQLYLTRNFLCLGSYIIPTASIISVKEQWTWLNPAVSLAVDEAVDLSQKQRAPSASAKADSEQEEEEFAPRTKRVTYLFTIWTRENFLKALKQIGLSVEGLPADK